jgi:hypothetical protein
MCCRTWAFQLKLLVRRKNRDRYAMKKELKISNSKYILPLRIKIKITLWIEILLKKKLEE